MDALLDLVRAMGSRAASSSTPVMGEPPMRCLAQRRLPFAAQKLEASQDAIRGIGLDAGYESEAAFNRAFKRAFGRPPAIWRRGQHERRRAAP